MIPHFNTDKFTKNVIEYYKKHQRVLPWRVNPKPYPVWISEIMSQQTRLDTVINYFNEFITLFPTIEDLAEAETEEVLKIWEGLGYYSRAKNLHKTAQIIVKDYNGIFPQDKKTLLSLPGIGPYTARAILSFVFNKPEPAIDGNFIRIATRIMAYGEPPRTAKGLRFQEDFWSQVISKEHPGDFNQGIMDIGATICRPNGEPFCSKCPLSFSCLAFQNGNPLDYPLKAKKNPRKVIEKTILLFELEDYFLFRQRPEEGLLSGLWEFPHLKGNLAKEEVLEYLQRENIHSLRIQEGPEYRHIFSHREWVMTSFKIQLDPFAVREIPENTEWLKLEELDSYTIPTAFKVFLNWIEENA